MSSDLILPAIPSSQWVGLVRENLSDRLGFVPRWDGTTDGAWTFAIADLAGQVSEYAQLVVSNSLLDTAPPPVVRARARDALLDLKPATYTTLECQIEGTQIPVLLQVGTILVSDIPAIIIGDDGSFRQLPTAEVEVIENLLPAETVTTGDRIVVRSVIPGTVILAVNAAPKFRPKNFVQGFGYAEHTSAYQAQIGTNEEPIWALRQRIAQKRSGVFGSPAGMTETIRAIPWVRAVGLVENDGAFAVYVVPGPVVAAQREQLAQTIYATHAVGIASAEGVIGTGTESQVISGADGFPVTVRWEEGTTENVLITFTLVLAPRTDMTIARAEASQAIRQVFNQLNPGDTVRYLKCIAALEIRSVLGATLTLNGGTADVSPSNAANLLVPVVVP